MCAGRAGRHSPRVKQGGLRKTSFDKCSTARIFLAVREPEVAVVDCSPIPVVRGHKAAVRGYPAIEFLGCTATAPAVPGAFECAVAFCDNG
jgi:hypothetical protein